ncbi:MAG: hypothetical protein KDK30_13905 [Leptospiraceae bacterium]|nr:hypothetical protein [Leptospiraceae bacterium]MCB1317708.1 hypothetical protein [Leptospiraceae bacterium]MCB1323292.1 hypothetical protein [Leptospiraceae bacterium]
MTAEYLEENQPYLDQALTVLKDHFGERPFTAAEIRMRALPVIREHLEVLVWLGHLRRESSVIYRMNRAA